ncbi:cilia- and flagella-associated protein 91 isoform X2 [Micropterus dolomieu]|uniref:cilia- and flagella-associated protein 91 isoform X2 n=1 Tax=Micropterus dolomieu TaxID=147949 RepID=UPI001E8D2169|nr:cilia- and flagella-associated protein 91 isoform X2 [Micropterus dolomieu]
MSINVTRTIPKKNYANKVVMRQRVYDYFYDPVYTVSSQVDHARSCVKAYASKDRVRRVPEFESMFSNLPHHPRYTVQLDPVDPVPVFIDRRWRGHTEQRRGALQQLAGVFPNAQPWLKREERQVTGADRWKYFKRPLIPFAQQVPPDVIFALPKEDFLSTGGNNTEHQPTHFTVGVQTDYRESEAQTDPYSPEYVVQPGTTPSELLQLAALTWGRGLPAGLAEVEMIERARAKQAWEATLPPLDDLSQLDKRRRMMEEMEAKEWAFREGEIQKLQEARLAVLKDLLKQRDKAQKDVTSERLNQIYSKHQKDKETKLHKIHNDYIRSLRKLEAKRRNVEGKLEQCGIVRDYTDSQTYTLQIRRDTFTNRNTRNNELKSYYLDTYEGLLELEAGLSASVLKPQVKRPKPKVNISKDVIKPPVSRAVELMKKYKALREEKNKQLTRKSLRFLVKKEKPVPRPVTPRLEEPPEGDEEIDHAIIQLQKLLRGRSIQYEMFMGKENHLALIQELRTVNALQREEQELQKADKELVMTLKIQRDKHRHKTSQEEASQARVVGEELEHLFDTLSKQLIHLQEERRIHAFTLLAERDRRLREAEESGRRQVEECRRREEDEIFRQVVQVHQETVDLYLEDIILGTLEQTADQQAREEIHRRAKEVNDIAYAMEESRNDLQSEEIVSELVYSFLIPEVEKFSVRQRVHQRQHRHLQAARSIIQGTAEHSGILPSTLGASRSIFPSERASNRVLKEMISQVEQKQGKEAEQYHTQTE